MSLPSSRCNLYVSIHSLRFRDRTAMARLSAALADPAPGCLTSPPWRVRLCPRHHRRLERGLYGVGIPERWPGEDPPPGPRGGIDPRPGDAQAHVVLVGSATTGSRGSPAGTKKDRPASAACDRRKRHAADLVTSPRPRTCVPAPGSERSQSGATGSRSSPCTGRTGAASRPGSCRCCWSCPTRLARTCLPRTRHACSRLRRRSCSRRSRSRFRR